VDVFVDKSGYNHGASRRAVHDVKLLVPSLDSLRRATNAF